MQTVERDPHLLVSDEEGSVWRAWVESQATKYATSGFFFFVRVLVPFAETFPAGH